MTSYWDRRGENYTEKILPFFKIKADESLGQVTAIVSVFGVIDEGRDRIWPGAFSKTISEGQGRIRVLDQHNTDSTFRILGRPVEMREVGREELPPQVLSRFPAATGGLLTVTQYNMKTQNGAETFHRIAAGDIDEYSIGFNSLDTDTELVLVDGKKTTVRNIRTIKLWEFSPVIWGSNPATATLDSKVGGKPMSEPARKDYQQEVEEVGDGLPVSLLGDKIHACLVTSLTNLLSWLYTEGWLSFDEFSALLTSGTNHLVQFRGEMPEVIVAREYGQQFYYQLMSGSPAMEHKADPTQMTLPGLDEGEAEQAVEGKEVTTTEETAGPPALASEEAPTDPLDAFLNRAAILDRKLSLLFGETTHA